ncbi:hypothetical protein [Vibrio phage vB_VneS_J26]
MKTQSRFSVADYFLARTFEAPGISLAVFITFAVAWTLVIETMNHNPVDAMLIFGYSCAFYYGFSGVLRLLMSFYIVRRCRRTERLDCKATAQDRQFVACYRSYVPFAPFNRNN